MSAVNDMSFLAKSRKRSATPVERLCMIATALFLFVLVGCGRINVADVQSVAPVVKIGLVAPFEGELAGIGNDIIWATRLAVRQINEGGGIEGHRVALVAYDDSSYPDEAENVAQALLVDPGIVAVVGHWTAETNAAASGYYADAGMAWVPMGTDGLNTYDALSLPEAFRTAYQQPLFNGHVPGPPGNFAGPAYDAMQLVFEAIDAAAEQGDVTRASVQEALAATAIEGMTGRIQVAE